jgi:hypothetical protein
MDDGERKKIVQLVDKIFIINLPTRLDRRDEMRQELDSVGWNDPSKVIWYPALDPKSSAGFPGPGARGCFLSELGAMNAARNMGCQTVMIIEDDCDLSQLDPDVEARIYDQIASGGFDICMLGHSHPHDPAGPLIISAPRELPFGLTHCYLLHQNILPEFCRYLEAMLFKPPGGTGLGPMHLDGAHKHFRADTGCVTWIVNPPVALQRSSRSDVGGKWFDKVPVLKDAVQAARKLRRSLKS